MRNEQPSRFQRTQTRINTSVRTRYNGGGARPIAPSRGYKHPLSREFLISGAARQHRDITGTALYGGPRGLVRQPCHRLRCQDSSAVTRRRREASEVGRSHMPPSCCSALPHHDGSAHGEGLRRMNPKEMEAAPLADAGIPVRGGWVGHDCIGSSARAAATRTSSLEPSSARCSPSACMIPIRLPTSSREPSGGE